jgi:protein phosphatase
VAHLGDSRAYVVNKREIYPLTKDHSLVGELLASGNITADEAKVHPHRNVLTRVLGVDTDYAPEWSATPVDEAGCLLLCSDGLYNMVGEDRIQEIVLHVGLAIDGKADLLIEEAKLHGGYDNITVILIEGEDGR